jgi:WD40 repeat protein
VETNRAVRVGRLSPDGKRAFVSSWETDEGGASFVWDVGSGEVRLVLSGDEAWKYPLAFAPHGTLAISQRLDPDKGGNHQLVLWDWTDGLEIRRFQSCNGLVAAAAFSADGKSVITVGKDGVLRRWGIESGQEQTHFLLGQGPAAHYALSRDGRVALTTSGINDYRGRSICIHLWDTATGKVLHTLVAPEAP